MTNLQKFEQSNAWHPDFQLPLVPTDNNPHIYLGFVFRLLGDEAAPLFTRAYAYICSCEIQPGYITRWPGSGDTSHDELMGAAYISSDFAERAIGFIVKNDGYYTVSEEPEEKSTLTRFFFLMPFLKACANYRVSLISQIMFSLHVLFSALFVKPGHTSGLLKIWLMSGKMNKYWLCKLSLLFWAYRWKKRGFTPKSVFTRYYLRNCPVFAEVATESWL